MREPVQILATGLLFPEGPVANADGSLFVSEIRGGTVRRIGIDGSVAVLADCKGGPNGAATGPDGALYVCNNGGNFYPPDHYAPAGPAADYVGGSIQRIDVNTGVVETLYTHCDGRRISSPNDLVFDASGGMYITDSGKKFARHRDHGSLYYAQPDGSRIEEVAFPISAANGVGLSPDGGLLYVAETESGRLWSFDVVGPGQLHKQPYPSPHGGRLVCSLPGYQRPDSLAVEANGNVCVATLVSGVVAVISPSGEIVRTVSFDDPYVTNLCFGGPDMKTAFVTLSSTGQLVSMPWAETGLKLNFSA